MKHRYLSSGVLALFLLAVLASPVFAKGPPVDETIYYTGVRFNPCTGQDQTIFATINLQIHEFEKENKTHLNIQYRWTITTDDGYAGNVVGPDVINISEGHETTAIIANGTLKNDSGQTIKVHHHIHVNIVDGEVRVDNNEFSRVCIGKSS
jgi:hypothetical protein